MDMKGQINMCFFMSMISYILKQTWCLYVCQSCKAGARQGRASRVGAGQGGQTFSVTLRITDFWLRSRFGNFDLLFLLFAVTVARIPDEISP